MMWATAWAGPFMDQILFGLGLHIDDVVNHRLLHGHHDAPEGSHPRDRRFGPQSGARG
jgi:hypothetical protein